MVRDSIRNKRVLITGINGFIGKALRIRLASLGIEVFGISRSRGDNKTILKANILDYNSIDKFIKKNKIQVCFHLASEALVENGQHNPFQTFKVNMEGTLNVLESARNNNLERIIIASSAHVYGKNKAPYRESHTPVPTRPYETSKACTDLIAQSYAKTFNLPVLIPRFVNIYGGGDLNFQRLVPKTIQDIFKNSHPKMWGGKAIRDYLFIDDAIDAYLLLANVKMKKDIDNGIFNFGSGSTISVENLIKKIIKISGKDLKINRVMKERKGEISSQYVSLAKAKKILGWKPRTGLDEGLKKTVDWYFKYLYTRE